MTPSVTGKPDSTRQDKLPRRDWILLPLLGLLTIVLLAVATESISLLLFPSSQSGLDRCFVSVKDDLSGQAPPRPDTVCSERLAESRFTAEYRFDRYGHRSDMDRDLKRPDTYRIVMMGSSLAFGLFTPREITFAGLLPKVLSSETGRPVELYNEARGGRFRGGEFSAQAAALKFDEVRSAAPDLILWIVTPVDMANPVEKAPDATPASAVSAVNGALPVEAKVPASPGRAPRFEFNEGWILSKVLYHWDRTRTSVALKHLLYGTESPGQYVNSYLKNEADAEFLRAAPSAHFEDTLKVFEDNTAEFERQAKAAGVPVVAVLVPNRAQAAMISTGEWPAGYDPYKVGDELRAIIVNHGGTYIDILPEFRKIPDPEQYYFPMDGHPDSRGQAMIAGMIAHALTNGAVPALQAHAKVESR